MRSIWPIYLALVISCSLAEASAEGLKVFPGYISRIQCEGRLFVSVVGNDQLVALQALPKELGCGVLLKPIAQGGQTNLILETSTSTIEKLIEIERTRRAPEPRELTWRAGGSREGDRP